MEVFKQLQHISERRRTRLNSQDSKRITNRETKVTLPMYQKYNLGALGYSPEVSEIKAHQRWSPAHLLPLRSLFTKMIFLTFADLFFFGFYFLILFRKKIFKKIYSPPPGTLLQGSHNLDNTSYIPGIILIISYNCLV